MKDKWTLENGLPLAWVSLQQKIPKLRHVPVHVYTTQLYENLLQDIPKDITLVITTTIGIPKFCESMFSPNGNTTLSSSDTDVEECRG